MCNPIVLNMKEEFSEDGGPLWGSRFPNKFTKQKKKTLL